MNERQFLDILEKRQEEIEHAILVNEARHQELIGRLIQVQEDIVVFEAILAGPDTQPETEETCIVHNPDFGAWENELAETDG